MTLMKQLVHRVHTAPVLLIALWASALAPTSAKAETPVQKAFVLLLSIDGLKPEAVLEADRHGLRVPNLRAFMEHGAYASAVRGVLPTGSGGDQNRNREKVVYGYLGAPIR